jgi:hypothetical protein
LSIKRRKVSLGLTKEVGEFNQQPISP